MKRKTEGIVLIAVGAVALACIIIFLGLNAPVLFIVTSLVVMGIGVSLLIDGGKSGKEASSRKDNEIVDSHTLHEEMNRDLKRDGKSSISPINMVGGLSSNTLARRDHSWSSVPDFFIKLFRRK